MKNKKEPVPITGELILYQSEDWKTRIEVRLQDETVWLSLNQLAELFQRDKSVISKHIRIIFEEGELPRDRVIANFATTAADITVGAQRRLRTDRDTICTQVGAGCPKISDD